jgi:dTDP-4-amino-4,6-dideoxygalactose transaminase
MHEWEVVLRERLAIHGGRALRTAPWPRWPEWGEAERAGLARVLESGSWGGFPHPNAEARAFAAEFAAYTGAAHAIACANGTFSLALALQAGRISPGAEVVTSVYTFVGTAGGILAAGALPVFADVRPDTWCLDPDAALAALTPRTEAVLPVHLGCGMADMDRLREICERRGLLLVEDCAHAHGMQWRGRGAGTLGHLGSFSMQSSKLLTAGEGGAVTSSDRVLAERVASLVNCGRREPGFDPAVEPMLGHNLRMTEWQAAILRAQLERLPEQHERRARNARAFEAALDVPGLAAVLPDPRVTRRAFYCYLLRYDAREFAGVPRDHLVLALRAEGIPCSGLFYAPLNEEPLLADDPRTNPLARLGRDWRRGEYPVATRAAHDASLWLPHELFLGSERDVLDIAAALRKIHACAADLRASPPQGVPTRR